MATASGYGEAEFPAAVPLPEVVFDATPPGAFGEAEAVRPLPAVPPVDGGRRAYVVRPPAGMSADQLRELTALLVARGCTVEPGW